MPFIAELNRAEIAHEERTVAGQIAGKLADRVVHTGGVAERAVGVIDLLATTGAPPPQGS